MISQLFVEKPSMDLVYRYCQAFGLSGMYDRQWFTKDNIMLNRLQNDCLDDLKKVYIKCKARSYLNDITDTAMTVLRQLVREYGYTLKSRSVSRNGRRVKEYQLNKI